MKSPSYFATFNSKHTVYVPSKYHSPSHELQIFKVPAATSLASVSTATSSRSLDIPEKNVSMNGSKAGYGAKVKGIVKRAFGF
jgi:hypothetical protein